jgi:hypothetical protein
MQLSSEYCIPTIMYARLHYAFPMFCTVYFKDNLCTEESKILYVNKKKSVFNEQRSILCIIIKNFSNKKYR